MGFSLNGWNVRLRMNEPLNVGWKRFWKALGWDYVIPASISLISHMHTHANSLDSGGALWCHFRAIHCCEISRISAWSLVVGLMWISKSDKCCEGRSSLASGTRRKGRTVSHSFCICNFSRFSLSLMNEPALRRLLASSEKRRIIQWIFMLRGVHCMATIIYNLHWELSVVRPEAWEGCDSMSMMKLLLCTVVRLTTSQLRLWLHWRVKRRTWSSFYAIIILVRRRCVPSCWFHQKK